MSLHNIPEILKTYDNWVGWKWVNKKNSRGVETLTKPPYDLKSNGTMRLADTSDPTTWASYEVALAEHSSFEPRCDGVGFRLPAGMGGVDFDGVIHDGVGEPFVLEILKHCGDPYAETTPSGEGLRAFLNTPVLPTAKSRKFHGKKPGVDKYGAEIYFGEEPGRYLTITGQKFSGSGTPTPSDIDFVHFLISQIGNERFKKLWMGDTSDYANDQSSADLALLAILARLLNNDVARIEKYFSASILGQREKWTDRKDYRDRTIAKAVQRSGSTGSLDDSNPAMKQLVPVLRDGDKVPLKRIKWLWPPRIPFGKITLFCGNPDNGKSVCVASIAAICTSGRVFPHADEKISPFEVLMMVGEDDIDDTAAPRLVAAGADMSKIKFFEGVELDEKQEIRLDEHLGVLETVLERNPNIRLVIIDPISNYLGKKSMNGEQDVRGILIPLKQIAARYGVAVILVMHLNKKSDLDAISRVGGAMAFIGVARCSWIFARDASTENGPIAETFTMARLKNNLAKAAKGGLSYRIEEATIITDDGKATAVRTVWGAECEKSANDVLNTPKNPAHRPADQKLEAVDWLYVFLKDGPKPLDDIEAAGKAIYGFTPKMIQRARKAAGIVTFPSGKQKARDGKMRESYSCRLPELRAADLAVLR